MEYDGSKIQILPLPEAVLHRATMYTMHGTFGEAVAFLDGYYGGGGRAGHGDTAAREWYDFGRWMHNRQGLPVNVTWWANYADVDDAQALESVADLYAQYYSQTQRHEEQPEPSDAPL